MSFCWKEMGDGEMQSLADCVQRDACQGVGYELMITSSAA